MTLLTLTGVERCYGDTIIVTGVDLRIDETDRIGVIGDNGTGKTTLLKVITGEDAPDAGVRTSRRDLRIASTSQIPDLPDGASIREAVATSFAELDTLERELRDLEERMAKTPDDAALVRRHDRVHAVFEAGGGYRRQQLAEQALLGLGFTMDELPKSVDVLSGGEKARLALARAMLLPCDLLVLDEPTNHLDLVGIDFLERWLVTRSAAVIVVSHDRQFLDHVCTSIVEIDSAQATRYRGNFTAFHTQKERNLETALREFKKQRDFIDKESAYIRKHMGGRWTAQAKGRLKRLSRLQRLAAPKGAKSVFRLRLGDKARGLEGQCVIEASGLSMSWPDGTRLFEQLALRVFHGDRVGLCGRNGSGKSTLLRIIAGDLTPKSGDVEHAKKLRLAWFRQEMEDLPTSGSVLEIFHPLVPTWTEGECRSWLARFLFSGDETAQDVATLSGGEKRRLCLALLLLRPADVYLMDEPTNHLDISTREALEDALEDFPGTALVVSHDRWFLRKVARRIFELQPDGIVVHEQGMEQFEQSLNERAANEKLRATDKRSEPPRRTRAAEDTRPDSGKLRNPWAFEKLEQRIMTLEEELGELQERIESEELWKDPDQLKSVQGRASEVRTELEALYAKWESWQ
ncbi:MAG: hypothetical protein CMJ85_10035 [Planctomycetes bacterium]|nr:hypothetical protein [Planctomycetota bacterium]